MARTKDNFEYSTDCNALTMIDYDYEEGQEYIAPYDLIEIIGGIFPPFADAAKIIQYSASSFIYEGDKNLTGDHPSYHIYLAVKDGQDIPRFFSNLYKLSWLAGYGFIKVSRAGSLLERSQLLDISVASPERLDFIAPAKCYGRLSQQRPDPEYIKGDALDTQLLPDLSREQRDEYMALISEAKKAIQPEAKSKREQYVDDEAEKLVEDSKAKGSPIAKLDARETVRNRIGGELTRNDILSFDNGKKVTVMAVLEDLNVYDGQTMCDPIEPEKGQNKAKFYANINQSTSPIVHSFVQGGKNYTLTNKKSLSEVRQELEELIKASVEKPDEAQWYKIIKDAKLSETDFSKVIEFLVSEGIGGKRDLKKMYKEQETKEEIKQKEEKLAEQSAGRRRIPIDMSNLNQMLCETEEVINEKSDVWGYYKYGGVLSMAIDVEIKTPYHSEKLMKTVMTAYERNSLPLLLDRHLSYYKLSAKGLQTPVKAPVELINAMLENPTPNAPTVTGLITHPTILPNGVILNKEGLDENSGLLLKPGGVEFEPVPENVSWDQAKAAFDFLAETLFSEYVFEKTSFDGENSLYKVVAVSLLLTSMVRKTIDMSPGFVISANTQGTGKTTLVRICHFILTSTEMPVLSLRGSKEEFEKEMLSTLLQSPELVCYDNVYDGCEVSNDTLSRVLSSSMFSGRKLGKTQELTLPTNTVFTLTGNNITICTDLTRRFLHVKLSADVERPEKRKFKHVDVAEHCRENRVAAIDACLTIMKGYMDSGQKKGEEACDNSGYPMWDKMVRMPLRWITGVDIQGSMDLGREESVEQLAIKGFINGLHNLYKETSSFSARDVKSLVNSQEVLQHDADETYYIEELVENLSILNEKALKSHKSLAAVFKRYRDRIIDGKMLSYSCNSSGNNGCYSITTVR